MAHNRAVPHQPHLFDGERLFRDVKTYDDLGEHRTGSVADNACSSWLRERLIASGYDVELQRFVGLVGSSPYAHTKADRASVATGPDILEPVARGVRQLLQSVLGILCNLWFFIDADLAGAIWETPMQWLT